MNNVMIVICLRVKRFANMDILEQIVLLVKRDVQNLKKTKQRKFPLVLDVPACEEEPCLNNGTCVVYLRSYLCRCSKGYTGRTCEIGKCIQ